MKLFTMTFFSLILLSSFFAQGSQPTKETKATDKEIDYAKILKENPNDPHIAQLLLKIKETDEKRAHAESIKKMREASNSKPA